MPRFYVTGKGLGVYLPQFALGLSVLELKIHYRHQSGRPGPVRKKMIQTDFPTFTSDSKLTDKTISWDLHERGGHLLLQNLPKTIRYIPGNLQSDILSLDRFEFTYYPLGKEGERAFAVPKNFNAQGEQISTVGTYKL